MKELMCPKEMPSETMTVERCVSPVSDEQRKEDAKERRKQYRREYYLKNKERISTFNKEYRQANKERLRAQSKEYREANRERIRALVREYDAANRERLIVYKREYYAANREHLLAQKKEYRAANRERILANMREYYAANREHLIAQKREYYVRNRNRLLVRQKEYYESNKYMCCYNKLNHEFFKSIEQIRRLYPEKINHYMLRYPFEEYAERYIKGELYRNKIFPSQDYYADCYDAGMLAYLYSIHRCAAMDYIYVVPYIKKMVRIYIICALAVYRDAKNLCEANGFQETRLDAGIPGYGY